MISDMLEIHGNIVSDVTKPNLHRFDHREQRSAV